MITAPTNDNNADEALIARLAAEIDHDDADTSAMLKRLCHEYNRPALRLVHDAR